MLTALQRTVAGAVRCSLGLPSSTGIAAAALSARSLLPRAFADDSGAKEEPQAAADASSSAPAEATEAAAAGGGNAAAAADVPAAAEAADAVAEAAAADDDDELEVPLEALSRRQRGWLGKEPERYKHFMPKLSRKERGAFGESEMLEEFDEETELYPSFPEDKPLYDLRTAVPEITLPQTPLFDSLRALRDANPDMTPEEMMEEIGFDDVKDPEAPFAGAEKILDWELRLVMVVGVNDSHPLNAKAKCRVHLRDLQAQCGLTDAALQHMAAVAGTRYNPNNGYLTLVSTKYPHREENRRHIVRTIKALVEEGHRRHPAAAAQQAAAAAQ